MKIDVRSETSLYIEIGGWTFYIDDSTNEQIMSKWETITGDSDTDELLEDEQMAQESMSIDIKYRTDEMGNQPIDRDKMIEEMDRKIAELVEGEVIEVPIERFIDCPQCHKESGCYVRKDGFAECKHCGYYLNKDGKYVGTKSCDICGKSDNVIEKKDSNSGNYYNICDSTECNTKEENDGKVSCDKCGGDGFIEYDNSSKKEGEVIESYDSEECNKCNGKGTI